MGILESLNNFDTQLFLALNGTYNSFFDVFFIYFTAKETWYFLYLIILYTLVKKYKRASLGIIIIMVLMIVAADQLSGLVKDLSARYRPSHEPLLAGNVHVPGKAGGLYGFFSSHASNSFALSVFLMRLFRNKLAGITLLFWALLTGYSRIYVGVHYPFDVLTGIAFGSFLGLAAYWLVRKVDLQFLKRKVERKGHFQNREINVVILTIIVSTITLLSVSFINL